MSDLFPERIKSIVLEHLSDVQFGVNELARELGYSRSQLLRKLKTSTGQSINQFIKEIRLQQAIDLLHNDELTISEIAYNVGFSSPSYFNKCFHDEYGLTPGEFRNKEEGKGYSDQLKTKISTQFLRKYAVVFIMSILLVASLSTYIFFNFQKATKIGTTSIAVLPFLNLSEKESDTYLADGITEAITLELSKQKDIRVISRTSAMRYKGKKKLSSVIADELDVDLLLEGSILHSADSLRVVVQLIKPSPKEKHLWSNSYDRKKADLLQIIGLLANEVSNEIDHAISPEVTEVRSKNVEPDVFDLYLRGRHLLNNYNPRSVQSSITYFNQVINEDSTYAPAYVSLAAAYVSLNKLIPDNEKKLVHRNKSRAAIDKALELDNKLAAAYIIKGKIIGKFDWQWEEMRTIVEKGLLLEPNNVDGHLLMSKYYLVKGEHEKSINEALLAKQLDPINPSTGCLVAQRYTMAKNYTKAIEQYLKVLELHPNYGFAWDGIGSAQYMSGQHEKAIESWRQLHVIMGNDSMSLAYADKGTSPAYKINLWLSKVSSDNPLFCSNPTIIASAYSFINDKEKALEFLNVAYQYRNEDLPVMLFRPNFHILYSNPKFQELAKKVKVEIAY